MGLFRKEKNVGSVTSLALNANTRMRRQYAVLT